MPTPSSPSAARVRPNAAPRIAHPSSLRRSCSPVRRPWCLSETSRARPPQRRTRPRSCLAWRTAEVQGQRTSTRPPLHSRPPLRCRRTWKRRARRRPRRRCHPHTWVQAPPPRPPLPPSLRRRRCRRRWTRRRASRRPRTRCHLHTWSQAPPPRPPLPTSLRRRRCRRRWDRSQMPERQQPHRSALPRSAMFGSKPRRKKKKNSQK
mmetsp:Transcript_27770/g.89312  ORF Transcript_27770/g.89312 Transcript_27770/m.89312 type:complete len:206 (+) Transcript_27770:2482-3099(+)